MLRPRHAAGVIVLASLHLACADGSGPELPTLIGSYAATTFVLTQPGLHPVDYLAGGSSLTIAIAEDSSVTGHLSIPAVLTGDEPFEADMAGTVSATGTTVTFDQDADTFIRDLTFTRYQGYLEANQPLNPGSLFHIRLDRVDR